jgi:hypothetical protein
MDREDRSQRGGIDTHCYLTNAVFVGGAADLLQSDHVYRHAVHLFS